MKSIILSSVVFLIFFIWPLIPRADAEVTGIEILDAGIIRAEVLGRLSNDQSSTGLMGLNRNTLKFVKSTDRIPAKLQTNFSVKYRVNGSVGESVTVTVKVSSPELIDAKTGRKIHEQKWTVTRTVGEENWDGYGFEEAWELV